MPAFIVFTHANVFNGKMDSGLDRDVTILVQLEETGKGVEGTITEIGSADAVTIPVDSTVVDLGGKYVIPGLINAHAHLFGTGKPMAAMSMAEWKQNLMIKLMNSWLGRLLLKGRMRKNASKASQGKIILTQCIFIRYLKNINQN